MKNSVSVWNVKENKFPKNGKMEGKLKFLLNYAILAPSGHNSQPWKFKIEKSSIIVAADYSKARNEVDPNNRELFISLGAAVRNIEVAADYFGLMYDKVIDKEKIILKFKNGKIVSSSKDLFKAITKRSTYRGEYLLKPVERKKIDTLNKLPSNGAYLKILEDKKITKKVANLVSESDLVWFKSRNLVEELEGWLRDDLDMSKDGLSTSVLSLYKVAVELKYLFSGDGKYARKRAKRDYEHVMKSPFMLVVATKTDSMDDWIEAGCIYETLALKLTALGLSSGFLNVVVQLKNPRKELAKIFNVNGVVQMLMRVGYAKEKTIKTQRRPIDEVLV